MEPPNLSATWIWMMHILRFFFLSWNLLCFTYEANKRTVILKRAGGSKGTTQPAHFSLGPPQNKIRPTFALSGAARGSENKTKKRPYLVNTFSVFIYYLSNGLLVWLTFILSVISFYCGSWVQRLDKMKMLPDRENSEG